MKICHACKKELQIDAKIGRREECPYCRNDLSCCLNCTFYDKNASKECREPLAELVKEKQKANYCDYFRFKETATAPAGPSAEKSRKELEDLFKR